MDSLFWSSIYTPRQLVSTILKNNGQIVKKSDNVKKCFPPNTEDLVSLSTAVDNDTNGVFIEIGVRILHPAFINIIFSLKLNF